MGVSKNNGTPKSSILIGFSTINHPFWGITIFGNTYISQEHCLRILSGLTLWPEAAAKLLHAGYIDCIIAAMMTLGVEVHDDH